METTACCHGQEAEEDLGDPLQLLLENQLQTVEFSGGQVIVDAARAGRIYLPGSFNPLHDGHKCVATDSRNSPREPSRCGCCRVWVRLRAG